MARYSSCSAISQCNEPLICEIDTIIKFPPPWRRTFEEKQQADAYEVLGGIVEQKNPPLSFGFCENLLACKNHAYNEYKIMEKSI